MVIFTINIVISQNNFANQHYLDPYNPEYVKGEVLIKFKDEVQVNITVTRGITKTGIESIDEVLEMYQAKAIDKVFKETREQRQLKSVRTIRDFKGKEIEVPALFNIYKLKFDTIWDAKQLSEELQNDENIEFAEPNYLVYTMEILESGIIPDKPPKITPLPSNYSGNSDTYPNDPLYLDGSQWYLDAIDAPAAWDLVTGDTTQIIGIIDTGVDWDHPDLDDNIWTNWNEIPDNGNDDDNNGYIDDIRGWDYVNNDNDPNDDNSHGTHVAGIAAAEGNNGIGICGVAWNARIMPVKMLQSSGSGSSSDLASAIEYASDNGATVINMSLGSYGQSGTVKNALYNAYVTSLLVAAAGNDGLCICSDCIQCGNMYPGAYPFVLGVSCEGGFSNTDPSGPIDFTYPSAVNYEVRAPGVNILSTIPNGYRAYNGTSMAAPLVSGICALAKTHNDTLFTDFLWAKLIFGSANGFVNAYNTLTLDLDSIGPDLRFLEYSLTDTLPGCDGDGRADAGETIQLHFTVKNVGGYADSSWTKIRFSEFEDTTTAIITDSTSYIGDISTWATLTGELSFLEIQIDSNVAHNRDIVFEYEIGCKNSTSIITNDLIINIERGIELSGVVLEDDTLHSEYLYLVNASYRIASGVTLYIEPGTEIQIYENLSIDVRGAVMAIGNEDSLIWVHLKTLDANAFIYNGGGASEYKYCMFTSLLNPLQGNGNVIVENCIFEECGFPRGIGTFRNNIVRNTEGMIPDAQIMEYNNFYNWSDGGVFGCLSTSDMNYNNFFGPNMSIGVTNNNWTNYGNSFVSLNDGAITLSGSSNVLSLPNQYWGGNNNEEIERMIWDFWDYNNLPMANVIPTLSQPSPLNHGHIWKVELNEINPFDETLDPLGSETVKFDVYFNKCMDTTYIPQLSFGVSEPYLQRIVDDNPSWSEDSTMWTAYYSIGQETGDGINTIRVQDAVDTAGFEIPVENQRFQFVIQAASAASIQFIATPGIGKVDLEWPPANTPDALGYNLYRYYNLTDSTYSNTTMINSELIMDTLYTDFNVIPDTTYHYLYTILGTDMIESDYSKKVTATPFDAANGDANGDLSVNVLDITTIVAYMLNQNPSPFLFDAADVNYDGQINVLDIIGLVQLISGDKSAPLTAFVDISDQKAFYELINNKLLLESEGNVAAMQFKFKVQGLKAKVKSVKILNELKIFSMAKGFEFAYSVVDDHIIGILFSLTGKEIPAGDQELFKFEGIDISKIEVSEIFGGDLTGNYVPILKKGQQVNLQTPDDYDLKVQPNPFTQSTVISWQLAEEAMVDVLIYNLKGEKIKQIKNTYQPAGIYQQTWNATDNNGKKLTAGIYICHFEAKTENQKITKDVKIILMK